MPIYLKKKFTFWRMILFFIPIAYPLQKVCLGNKECPEGYVQNFDFKTVTQPDDFDIFITLDHEYSENNFDFGNCVNSKSLKIQAPSSNSIHLFHFKSNIEITNLSIFNSRVQFRGFNEYNDPNITVHNCTLLNCSFGASLINCTFLNVTYSYGAFQYFYNDFLFDSMYLLFDQYSFSPSSNQPVIEFLPLHQKSNVNIIDSGSKSIFIVFSYRYTDDDSNYYYYSISDESVSTYKIFIKYFDTIITSQEKMYLDIIPLNENIKQVISISKDIINENSYNFIVRATITPNSYLQLGDEYAEITPLGFYSLELNTDSPFKKINVAADGLELIFGRIYAWYYIDSITFEPNGKLTIENYDHIYFHVNHTYFAPGSSIVVNEYNSNDVDFYTETNYYYNPSNEIIDATGMVFRTNQYQFPIYILPVSLKIKLLTAYSESILIKIDYNIKNIKTIYLDDQDVYDYFHFRFTFVPQSEAIFGLNTYVDGTEINQIFNQKIDLVCGNFNKNPSYYFSSIDNMSHFTDFRDSETINKLFNLSYTGKCISMTMKSKVEEFFQHFCLYSNDKSRCPSYSIPVTPQSWTHEINSSYTTKIYVVDDIDVEADVKFSPLKSLYIVGIPNEGKFPEFRAKPIVTSNSISMTQLSIHSVIDITAKSISLKNLFGNGAFKADAIESVHTDNIDAIDIIYKVSDIQLLEPNVHFNITSKGLRINDGGKVSYELNDPFQSIIISTEQFQTTISIECVEETENLPPISLITGKDSYYLKIVYSGNIKYPFMSINASSIDIKSSEEFLPFILMDCEHLYIDGDNLVLPKLYDEISLKTFTHSTNSSLLVKRMSIASASTLTNRQDNDINKLGDTLYVEDFSIGVQVHRRNYHIYNVNVLKTFNNAVFCYFYGTLSPNVVFLQDQISLFYMRSQYYHYPQIILKHFLKDNESPSNFYIIDSTYDFDYESLSYIPSEYFYYNSRVIWNAEISPIYSNNIRHYILKTSIHYDDNFKVTFSLLIFLPGVCGIGLLFSIVYCCFCSNVNKREKEFDIMI
ncbi:hypothetical protein TRFO_40563 [Tritrichomonas foetus]|uniref:Uncharacterized protein n=1 Tax=Tritrichomonas foetus TaxID=1144522 RepID=A0A1J4J123_9EUKA|nr:hypothetical protein TRFO_40563 [Tritrichomonas foetus]|eukprot:OHS93114.1 hypothetical protein TRFO_40563 [Tritrichomonas foetus]